MPVSNGKTERKQNKNKLILAIVLGVNLFSVASYLGVTNKLGQTPQVLGVVSGKEGYTLRYSNNIRGGLKFTGNTLCLSDVTAITDTKPHGTCGAFIGNDPAADTSIFPTGTTDKWELNSSSANLSLPENSDIVYAELIWGGSYKYTDIDLTDKLDNPIKFTTPDKTFSIISDPSTRKEVSEANAYVRTANVTEIMKKSKGGTFTVGSVPATMVPSNPYNNYAGWTLAIAYQNFQEPPRNINIFTAAENTGQDQFDNTAEIKGFSTPTTGNLSGRLLVSAQEGDSIFDGDQMFFGSDRTKLNALSGPNNKKDNFFASQINKDDGTVNLSGSFGSNNQKLKQDIPLTRQGWDVTNVDISSYLKNSQTTAYARGSTTGDGYVINALGIQFDVNAAKPKLEISTDKSEVKIGDIITYSIKIKNEGSATSSSNILKALIPASTKLVEDSLQIEDASSVESFKDGINLQDLKAGQTVTVKYQVEVAEVPDLNKITNDATLEYKYQMNLDGDYISDISKSNQVANDYNENPNRPPVALNDEASGESGSKIIIDVLQNDSDPDQNLKPGTLQITSKPKNGSVKIESGKVSYISTSGFTGKDSFEYKICDEKNLCATAKVDVNIKEATSSVKPPIANNDSSTTNKNTAVKIDVLKNDIFDDQKYGSAKITITSDPVNGNVSVADGMVNYTPKSEFVGTDTFNYTLCDLTNLCSEAKVEVKISETVPVLKPPIANNDSSITNKNTAVKIDILKNDIFDDQKYGSAKITITSDPVNGNVSVADGMVNYTPKSEFVGTDTFNYTLCDLTNLCSEAKVEVKIEASAGTPSPATPPKNTADTGRTRINIQQNNASSSEPVKVITQTKQPIVENQSTSLEPEKTEAKTTETNLNLVGATENTQKPEPEPETDASTTSKKTVLGIVDKQTPEDEFLNKKPKPQILGVHDVKELVRTGGEIGLNVLLPVNLLLLGGILVMNISSQKTKENLE